MQREYKIRKVKSSIMGTRAYEFGECFVMVGREDIGSGNYQWHLSISHPNRYPTWDEIRDARDRFVPDHVTMVMFLLSRADYVNTYENCFHLWELDEKRALTENTVEKNSNPARENKVTCPDCHQAMIKTQIEPGIYGWICGCE
ncbi:MAG: DUF7694 domain-containing protein [Bacillota bacterium]